MDCNREIIWLNIGMRYLQKTHNLLIGAFIDFNRISLLLKKIKCIKPNNKPTSQLNIEISEEVSEGSYAHLEIITHSHAEFVVDFVSVMPGHAKK